MRLLYSLFFTLTALKSLANAKSIAYVFCFVNEKKLIVYKLLPIASCLVIGIKQNTLGSRIAMMYEYTTAKRHF